MCGDKSLRVLSCRLCHNPVLYITNKTLAAKCLDPQAPIVPLHPAIREALEPNPKMWKSPDMAEKAAAFAKAFPVTKVESKKARAAKTTPWGLRADVEEEGEGQGEAKRIRTQEVPGGLEAAVAEASKVRLSTVNAIEEFSKVLSRKNEDEVTQAIEQMQGVIIKLVEEGEPLKEKAVKHVELLRQGCIEFSRGEDFNRFLKDLIDKLAPSGEGEPFWDLMAESQISLITKEEQKEGLQETKEGAEAFLKRMQDKMVAVKEEMAVEEPDDDLALE